MTVQERDVFIKEMDRLHNLAPGDIPLVNHGWYGEDYPALLSLIDKGYLSRDPVRGEFFCPAVTDKGIQEFERIFKTKWEPSPTKKRNHDAR